LKNKTDNQFTYIEDNDICEDGGVLGKESWSNTISYSINNNIMIWEPKWSDTLNFKGTSNELIGTWTRTKDRATSCKLKTEREETYYDCKENWRAIEAVFTQTTVKITSDYCLADHIIDGEIWYGGDGTWKERAVNCKESEVYKGTEKVTLKEDKNSAEAIYKDKSCKTSKPLSQSEKETACIEAWNKYHDGDYYYDLLHKDFYDCLKEKMPKGFWVIGDDEYAQRLKLKPKQKLYLSRY